MNRPRRPRKQRSQFSGLNRWRFRLKRRFLNKHHPSRRGFTLTEILVSSVLLSIVILMAWTGLLAALNMSNVAQAKTARKTELSMALNFMNQEIRQAQVVNQSGTLSADGSTVTLEDVVSNSGLNLSDLGNYGDLALYLEVPTNRAITACPAGDGLGQIPADAVDRVVYDVRNSPSEWLAPKAIARYGRIPAADGSINPCSAPVTGDIMADAISDINETPFCDGVLTGGAGFHACVQGETVNLMVKSSIQDIEVPTSATSTVTSRAFDFTQPTNMALNLALARSGEHHVDLSWTWNPTPANPHTTSYNLTVEGPNKTELQILGADKVDYKYDLNKVASEDPDSICFQLETQDQNGNLVTSNQICTTYDIELLDQDAVFWNQAI